MLYWTSLFLVSDFASPFSNHFCESGGVGVGVGTVVDWAEVVACKCITISGVQILLLILVTDVVYGEE